MKKLILDQKIDQLQKEFLLKRKQLMQQYCDANNPYKVGDKFTDHLGTIVVEKIEYVYNGGDTPHCVYLGVGLKKNGKDNNNKRYAYQSNEVL